MGRRCVLALFLLDKRKPHQAGTREECGARAATKGDVGDVNTGGQKSKGTGGSNPKRCGKASKNYEIPASIWKTYNPDPNAIKSSLGLAPRGRLAPWVLYCTVHCTVLHYQQRFKVRAVDYMHQEGSRKHPGGPWEVLSDQMRFLGSS